MTSPFGMQANQAGLASPMFKLDYPQSVGVYTSYSDAQKDVDSLSDQNFPVANLAIVGTDLKLVERVTGRKTWGTVLSQGVTSGLSTGLMVALIMWLIMPGSNFLSLFALALGIGISIGVGFGALGYAMSRGQRDFTSVSQVVPSKYEILCEHKFAAQARQLLAQTPQGRAAAFDPNRQAQWPYPTPQPYGAPASPYPPQPPYPPYPVDAAPAQPGQPAQPAPQQPDASHPGPAYGAGGSDAPERT